MAETLPYYALITPQELRVSMFKSFTDRVIDALATEPGSGDDQFNIDVWDGAVLAIVDVTDRIERYLNRHLIVRPPHAQRFRMDVEYFDQDWREQSGYETASGAPLSLAYSREWPLLQVTAVDQAATYNSFIQFVDKRKRFAFNLENLDGYPYMIQYYAGYKRRDQALADLQAADPDLAALTEEPEDLPGLIRRVAIRLTVAEIREELTAIVGLSRITKRIDNVIVDTTALTEDFAVTEIRKLAGERWRSF